MKHIAIVAALFVMPLFTYAGTWVLPNGNIYIEPTYRMQLFTLPSGLKVWSHVLVEHVIHKAEASEKTLQEVIEDYVDFVSEQLGIDAERVKHIIECESNWSPKALNPKDTDGLPAYGILQFKKGTFYGAGGHDIWSWREQIDIGLKLMADGYWRKWPTCNRRALSMLSY